MIESRPARRRLLGTALRRYRESNGFDLAEAARILGCHRSKVSRIETGERGIRLPELHTLFDEYGVADDERRALTAIALAQHWSENEGHNDLPGPYREYLGLEQAASSITIYDPLQIPDLVLHHGRLQPLPYGPRTVVALIGDTALQQQTSAELNVLIRLRDKMPLVTVRIVPSLRPPAIGGTATLLRFGSASSLGAVYLTGPNGGIILVGEEDVLTYSTAFDHINDVALSTEASVRHIRKLALQRR